jgi:hypothetical protein
MDWALFQRITKGAVEAGVEEVGLFYLGESFLAPELLVPAIRYLKDELKVPYVFLTSNASMATTREVKRCMKAGLDSLKWSVNASGPEEFAQMMGVSQKVWHVAMRNIADAHKIRAKCGFKTRLYASSIACPDKLGDRKEVMRPMLEQHVLPYVDEHYWLPLYTMGQAGTVRVGEKEYQPVAGNQGRADMLVPPLPCWSLFTVAHVMVDGRMTACCFDADGKWVVGDLVVQSFMDCWHSTEFQRLRQAHLAMDVSGTACEHCANGGM